MSAFTPMDSFNPNTINTDQSSGWATPDYHLVDKQIVDVVITHISLDTPPPEFDRPARVRIGVRVPDGPARGYSWFFNLNILAEGDRGLNARRQLQALGYFARVDSIDNALKVGRIPTGDELQQLKGSRQRVRVSQFCFRDGKNAGSSYQGVTGIIDPTTGEATSPLMAVKIDFEGKPQGQPYALTQSADSQPASQPQAFEEDLPF